jgi:flagellar biosynthesis regulator FlaF
MQLLRLREILHRAVAHMDPAAVQHVVTCCCLNAATHQSSQCSCCMQGIQHTQRIWIMSATAAIIPPAQALAHIS